MQVSLELSGHPKANVQQVVLHDSTIVGRSRECGLQIASGTVSRKHCEIRIKGSSVSVLDLGSSNGTFIDAERLPAGEERVLPSGCRLNVGGVRFVVLYGEPAAADQQAPKSLAREEGGVTAAASMGLSELELGISDPAEEPVLAEEPNLADEPALADEPLIGDQPILADDDPILLSDDAGEDRVSASESDFDISLELAEESEPLFDSPADGPIASTRAMETETPQNSSDEEDEPIIEVDEDQALAFLNDDDELSK